MLLRDWKIFQFNLKIESDICHFFFYAHAECTLQKFNHMLSVRKKKLTCTLSKYAVENPMCIIILRLKFLAHTQRALKSQNGPFLFHFTLDPDLNPAPKP